MRPPTEQNLSRQDIAVMPLQWGGYIIRPADEKWSSFGAFPNDPGIYAMYTRAGDLMYVGRSVAIQTRLRQHAKSTSFWGGSPSLYSFKLVPRDLIATVEIAHIRALAPIENSFMEGCGSDLFAPMTKAIEHIWRDDLPVQQARLSAQYGARAEQIAARL